MRIADAMREKLSEAFAPSQLVIQDDSARHGGHAGATREDGSQGETHFTVRIVSASFDGLSRVERQRRIHAVLAPELAGPVHALSLIALSPAEARTR